MASNLDRYKKDLEKLIQRGEYLEFALRYEFGTESEREQILEQLQKKAKKRKNSGGVQATTQSSSTDASTFRGGYQEWYSEAREVIKQILPDRLDDFVRYYERPKRRKELTFENYTIEDCLQGLKNGRLGPGRGVGLFRQQRNILKSARKRFESSLFDIRQLVQADLFDSELDAARVLVKNHFARGAGAMAGVVLEKHLAQVASNHSLSQKKKNPGINDWSQLLKDNGVIGVPLWRRIQSLADTRNLCSHDKQKEPSKDDVTELIDGVEKIIKTLF